MKKKLYVVTCADWVVMSEGYSAEAAATSAFEKMMMVKGENMVITPIIDTVCYSDLIEDHEVEQYREQVDTVKTISDAGFHDSAKAFQNIIDNQG